MFHLLLFGAILLTNLVNGNVNISCYECYECTSTPANISTGNRFCLRIQVHCMTADIHIIDLKGDALYRNQSFLSCGQILSYSSACTIAYQCCYTNKCNTFEYPFLSSSSSSLFTLNRILIGFLMIITLFPS